MHTGLSALFVAGYGAGAYGSYGRRLQAAQATLEQPQAKAEEPCLRNGISSAAFDALVRTAYCQQDS